MYVFVLLLFSTSQYTKLPDYSRSTKCFVPPTTQTGGDGQGHTPTANPRLFNFMYVSWSMDEVKG